MVKVEKYLFEVKENDNIEWLILKKKYEKYSSVFVDRYLCLNSKIFTWMKNNNIACITKSVVEEKLMKYSVCFKTKEDAILFKLTWS